MISPMNKYAFFVYHKEYKEFLKNIGKHGVVHISEPDQKKNNDILDQKSEKLASYEDAIKFLKDLSEKQTQKDIITSYSTSEAISRLNILLDERTQQEERKAAINSRIEKLVPWGEYDPQDFSQIKETGLHAHFYRCPVAQFKEEWKEKQDLFTINNLNGLLYFLVISDEKNINIEAETESMPDISADSLKEQYKETECRLEEIGNELNALIPALETLENEKQTLSEEIELISIALNTQKASENKLMLLEGWIPEESETKVLDYLKQQEIVYFQSAPSENDAPPIHLKNGKFASLFEPIGELYNLPDYKEMDLTPFFAPFFMLFFGFCLGDAGYGVFLFLVATILKLKKNKKIKPILSLTQYLGIATILFGIISGTFFGINLIDSGYTISPTSIEILTDKDFPVEVVNGLKIIEGKFYETRSAFIAALNENIDNNLLPEYKSEILRQSKPGNKLLGSIRHLMLDPLSMFYFSIIIGGLQIVFSFFVKIFNTIKQLGFKHSLSSIGWFIMLLSLIIFVGGDKLGILSLASSTYLFYAFMGIAGILIFFFNNPDKNIFARFGSGIWDTYGVVIGLFGDLLSYIRLFALGISSAILGFVFNDISMQFLEIPYIGWLLFLILLLVGHSINLFLAALGGFIHPMRLTFVEFYKNAGFQGGGKKYKPFQIKQSI